MGVLITCDPPVAGSNYDRVIIYRSTSQAGTYSAINGATGQAITDLTYYDEAGSSSSWYKISYYNSNTTTESGLSSALQGQATTYTTVRKVQSILQLSTRSDSTNPSIQEIVELINRKEDEIDYICLEENTKIPIGNNYIPIKDIKEGDTVFTYDFERKEIVSSSVKRLIDNGEKDVYLLSLMNREIKATEDHMFPIAKKVKNPNISIYEDFIKNDDANESPMEASKKYGVSGETIRLWRLRQQKPREYFWDIVWEPLKNIAIGDKVLISNKSLQLSGKSRELGYIKPDRNGTTAKSVKIPTHTSEDMMMFLGGVIGDGYIGKDQLNIAEYDEQKIQIYSTLIDDLFGCGFSVYANGININSIEICDFIRYVLEFEKTNAHDKILPSWLFTLPETEIKAFLDGIMISDGHKRGNRNHILFCNRGLTEQIKDLCDLIGYPTTQIIESSGYGFGKMHTRYSFVYNPNGKNMGGCLKRFADRIGDDVGFNYVNSIEYIGKAKVYDIEVDNPNHNFIAQGIVVHNCGHAWRLRFSGTNSGQDTTAQFEMMDITGSYEYHAGTPIYLKHRKLRDLSAAAGDALEFWNGSAWESWLTTKIEGRGNDYWFDYPRGILYLRGYRWMRKAQGVRIKYRYGETAVNRDIEDICTKLVAMDILVGMDTRTIIVQEGQAGMSHAQRVDKWEQQIENKLNRYKEWQVPLNSL